MTEIARVFANNLKRLRAEKNLTQAQLAEAIDVAPATVAAWESQRRWPGIEHVVALSHLFMISDTILFQVPAEATPTILSLTDILRSQEKEIEDLKNTRSVDPTLQSITERIGEDAVSALAECSSRAATRVRAALTLPLVLKPAKKNAR